ncbi:MAG: signal peptidase, partial [Pseudonocardia sp.]|nr:signal peptidase [Pseudonocardia sp.]
RPLVPDPAVGPPPQRRPGSGAHRQPPAQGQPPQSQPVQGQPPQSQPPLVQPPLGQPVQGQPVQGQPPFGSADRIPNQAPPLPERAATAGQMFAPGQASPPPVREPAPGLDDAAQTLADPVPGQPRVPIYGAAGGNTAQSFHPAQGYRPGEGPAPLPGTGPGPGPAQPPGGGQGQAPRRQPAPARPGQAFTGQADLDETAPGVAIPGLPVRGQLVQGETAPGQPVADLAAPEQGRSGQSIAGRGFTGQAVPDEIAPGQSAASELPRRVRRNGATPASAGSHFGPTSLVPLGGTGSSPADSGTPAGLTSVERLAMDSPTENVGRPVGYRSIGSTSGNRAVTAPPRRPADRRASDSVDLFQPAGAGGPTTAAPVPADTETEQRSKAGRHHRPRSEAASDEVRPPNVPAGGRAKRPKGGRRRRPTFWRELPMLIVVALLLTFLIQTFLARVYEIPSGSMETTLHGCTGCTNDRVLVDKLSYRFGDPAPGDVIVFRGPTSWEDGEQLAVPSSNALVRGLQSIGSLVGLAPPDEKDLIKRVIAVGGQTVTCCDAQNRITVDGKPLNEPYIYYLPEAGPPTQSDFGPIKVPDGQLWVMGDSRNNSSDSRVPGHGPIPVANVIGKARFVVLPFSRIKSIDDTNPQRVALSAPSTAPAGAPLALGVIGAVPLTAGRRWWLRRRRRPRRRTGRDSVG